MPLAQIKQMIEANKDNQDVQNYLKGLNPLTPEGVTAFLDTAEGKKILQPKLDQHFTKGLETWKEKTFPTLVEEEIKKKFPAETEEQKRMRKLEDELAKEREARIRSELANKATTLATEKGLPVDLVAYFVGQDEETTLANIGNLETAYQKHLQAAVEAKFKENGRTPNKGAGGGGDKGGEFGAELGKKQQEGAKKHQESQGLYFK